MHEPENDRLRLFVEWARSLRRDTRTVERGFENRVMARLKAEREGQLSWLIWLHRLVPVLAVLVITLAAWDVLQGPGYTQDLYGAITGSYEESWIFTPFNGD